MSEGKFYHNPFTSRNLINVEAGKVQVPGQCVFCDNPMREDERYPEHKCPQGTPSQLWVRVNGGSGKGVLCFRPGFFIEWGIKVRLKGK